MCMYKMCIPYSYFFDDMTGAYIENMEISCVS